jgi:hypothetical protein
MRARARSCNAAASEHLLPACAHVNCRHVAGRVHTHLTQADMSAHVTPSTRPHAVTCVQLQNDVLGGHEMTQDTEYGKVRKRASHHRAPHAPTTHITPIYLFLSLETTRVFKWQCATHTPCVPSVAIGMYKPDFNPELRAGGSWVHGDELRVLPEPRAILPRAPHPPRAHCHGLLCPEQQVPVVVWIRQGQQPAVSPLDSALRA